MLRQRANINVSEIVKLYQSGLTARQIAAKVGASFRTVLRRLNSSGIALRNAGSPEIPELADKDWLMREYWGLGKSTPQIARELDCGSKTVHNRLVKHGIPLRTVGSEKGHARTTEEARRKQSQARIGKYIGEKNPNWRGGITTRDLDRSRSRSTKWTKAVKDRDGWKCVDCGSEKDLHAHHIKSWRKYPEHRYDLDNGKTLCRPCHEKAHGWGFRGSLARDTQKTHERTAP